MPFDQQAFDTWINDLRTTTETQGRDYLRNGDAYCCLGRAVECLDPDGWQGSTYGSSIWKYNGQTGILSKDMSEALGLDIKMEFSNDGTDLMDYLTTLNDSGCCSFKMIANIAASMIERFKRKGLIQTNTTPLESPHQNRSAI